MKEAIGFSELMEENKGSITIEMEINVLYEMVNSLLEEKVVRERIIKYRLEEHVESKDPCKKLYAINKIISDGKGEEVPFSKKELPRVLEDTNTYIGEAFAKRYVQNKIEKEVEKTLEERQEKYYDEVRLSIIRKQKGAENAKTLKKYADLEVMDSKKLSKGIQQILRPDSFEEIVGQERAIKSILSKLASPYPQHIILYGPPGVGKTTAARLALLESKKIKFTPFNKDSKFVEVDGATLRWDPREITNPLLGSVHDPIYMGSKKDLAETGIPEPKPGLVTDAHGGVLFIDEIGEMDEMLQNKLLKVLEDKRVEFSSSYYDPDDESTPKYVKYLFDKGAPADFILIGATTREPHEINAALRSRCAAVYFEPLSNKDIEEIVRKAAKKLSIEIEDTIPEIISRYTIEGRRAVNMLADVYGYALFNDKAKTLKKKIKITEKQLMEVISISRLVPYENRLSLEEKEIGHVFGLGVSGFIGSTIEIEAALFEAKSKGEGAVRFNDTAGSMAKDSVFNAASVIRKITDKDIRDYDVHVNIVGGGNIDGPSAGAAITISIISSLLEKPIRQDIAITGEISLRGKIKPVGGIFEKIYGAKRHGIKTVIIPKENMKDVPFELQDIEIISVDTIQDLMNIVF